MWITLSKGKHANKCHSDPFLDRYIYSDISGKSLELRYNSSVLLRKHEAAGSQLQISITFRCPCFCYQHPYLFSTLKLHCAKGKFSLIWKCVSSEICSDFPCDFTVKFKYICMTQTILWKYLTCCAKPSTCILKFLIFLPVFRTSGFIFQLSQQIKKH